MNKAARYALGVTLVEMIVVITITGIIAAGVAIFIRRPVEAYIESVRRAELTDKADAALRRINRDLRLALPNSVRVAAAGGAQYLEFLITSGGGRYREQLDDGGNGDVLDFTAADDSFDVLGPMPAFAGGEFIVVYNLFADPAVNTSNAYGGDNRAVYAGNAGGTITLAAPRLFPFASPARRFHVVQHAVTYECNPAAGTVRRYWNYPIALVQGTPPAGGNDALLVDGVSGCGFAYEAGVTQRSGLVSMRLQITQEGETVSLLQQTHVTNVP
ncbi:MAG: prepilin-type N-terminal cleavage/methylation domain-containing protein [Burkholderiales bacterium]|nr:prepilin-type N-terminal cleavage/methylation domain-containing protein [Burkholderiales bacterium]